MATTSTVPRVKVTAVEGGHDEGHGGFLVTCTACPQLRLMRVMRIDADLAATGHARTHARPSREDEEE
ncbi:hypothetical protein [Nocardioides sp. T2.26MG-1]|uniref:hypothetical protein n=1 Tax=Nocardioides sp. T2.26MG-1 TaxID=3041166 RepID=UPI002477488B|nr:hypothetical protein [Nocardioides sp. T2.26MG-1]CAI9417237.1 hypothetical protein HIDPHFAB_02970 [Nocardioides sp. T2.26MG-1]